MRVMQRVGAAQFVGLKTCRPVELPGALRVGPPGRLGESRQSHAYRRRPRAGRSII